MRGLWKNTWRRDGWPARLAWLLGLWAAGVGGLAVVAYVLRLVMKSLGMTAGAA